MMVEIPRILCPIDFSDYSRHALEHAVALARRYQSAITVLHVFSTLPTVAYATGMPGLEPMVLTLADRDQLLATIQRFIEPESASGVVMNALVREGNTAGEIVDQATDMRAGLVVMGTHGRTGFDRLLLGSVTEKVLRKATCPVLTIPRRHPDAVPATPALFRRILCPVDFSDCSMQALAYAIALTQELGAQLTVLHVMSYELAVTPEMYGAIIMNDPENLGAFYQRYEAESRRRMSEAVPATVAASCSVETMVSTGKPGREILRVATEQPADLIVVGVQGRGAVDLTCFGSTTNQVVREAVCPVLTIRRS
jgi:nucleotide-binding universal stress UspA family protein